MLLLSLAPKGKHTGSLAEGLLFVTLQPGRVGECCPWCRGVIFKVFYLFALF